MIRKLGQVALLAFTLVICLWTVINQELGIAATLTSGQAISDMASQSLSRSAELEVDVNDFLTDIPTNYYAIGSIKKLKVLLETNSAVLIDVREPSEYATGHIPNAINIPLRTLASNRSQIPHDHPVVLY